MGGAEGRRGIFMSEVSGLIPQDYTTYTEKDDFGRLTVSPTSVVSNLLTRNEDAWLVKDFGAGYFDGDSTRELDFVVTGGDNFGIQYPLVLANVIDDVTGLGDHVFLWNRNEVGGLYSINLNVVTSGVAAIRTGVVANVSQGQRLFATIAENSTVGLFGIITCSIYSDVDRTVLHGEYVATLQAPHPGFRYLYGIDSHNSGNANRISGDSRNLAIG